MSSDLYLSSEAARAAAERVLTDFFETVRQSDPRFGSIVEPELEAAIRREITRTWRSGRAQGFADGERIGWLKGFTAAAKAAVDKARDILAQAVTEIDSMTANLTDGS